MRSRMPLCMNLLLTCLVTTASSQEVFERENGLFVTEEIEAAMPVEANAKILIASAENLSGELTITTAETDSLRVTYTKVAKASTRSQAIDFIDLISVIVEGRLGAPVVRLRSPNPAPWSGTDYSGRIEATILVPHGADVEIAAQTFDVTSRGPLRGLEILESLGRLDISGITERLQAATANRRVMVSDITGKISVATTNSSLIAESINSLEGQARFRNEEGEIQIDGFIGSINARNSFGRITIEDFEPRGEGSYIRGASGPVSVEIVSMSEGQLVITNRQEDIDISVPDSLSAFYTLSVGDDGVIEATNFSFTPDMVQPSRLSLQSGDGQVDIRGTIKGKGNIYIRGRAGD